MVEKPNLVDDLPAFIEQGVQSFVTDKAYKYEKTATGYRIVSVRKWKPVFGFGNQQKVETFQYDLNIDIKPHGRSGEIYVNPVAFEKLNETLAPNKQSATEWKR